MTEPNAEPRTLQIEVWADLICPWCGLGDHRLRQALERFDHSDEVQVVHRAFQLDPNFPTGVVRSVPAVLREKYGADDEQIERSNRHLEEIAAAEGLAPYVVYENEIGNTAMAHELLAFAADRGLGEQAWQRLFEAHFAELRSIFDLESLIRLGVEVGLSADSIRTVLDARIYAAQIEDEAAIAQQLGATGVPFFVFDRRFAVAGAHSADDLLSVLDKAWAEFSVVREAYSHAHTDDH